MVLIPKKHNVEDFKPLGRCFCPSPSLLAFSVPLCILPVYELESLFLGSFFNIFSFYRSKKKKDLRPIKRVMDKVIS